jgi:hypothetical protein
MNWLPQGTTRYGISWLIWSGKWGSAHPQEFWQATLSALLEAAGEGGE